MKREFAAEPAGEGDAAVGGLLPPALQAWLDRQGWTLRSHQIGMIEAAVAGKDALLIAPTGGGKTLGGFLPSLMALTSRGAAPVPRLHTLYISPLKALTADVARNLIRPIEEAELPVTVETRTGDTPQNRRARQKRRPPDILLTTPESLALMLSWTDAAERFAHLDAVIVDELHALAETKRGQMLALCLARLRGLAPQARFSGLSATVADPPSLLRFLSPDPERAVVVHGEPGAEPEVTMLVPDAYVPWSGHLGLFAVDAIYRLIRTARTSLLFTNTRSSAEVLFAALWRANEDGLPIALHHGSLSVEQRKRVEAAMTSGRLRAVVCTSSLDLGIDWGDVDLVLQIGAPKGVARLVQRIGRANHRMDEPSRAVLVPANRFEFLECVAAQEAVREGDLDTGVTLLPGLDVLAQHVLGVACSGPFLPDQLYAEVTRAEPYRQLTRKDFDDVVQFCTDGGYALGGYERYRRLVPLPDGSLKLADPRIARQWRMNVGVIVEAPVLRVKLGRRTLGEVEEFFIRTLTPGDTFIFAGQVLEFLGIREHDVQTRVVKDAGKAEIPLYGGSKFPVSTYLAARVRRMLGEPESWHRFPDPVREWLHHQVRRSALPPDDGLLVETFSYRKRWFLVAYAFAGRNAHQTLGMLLTRRMQRGGLEPHGFVASDYAISIWSGHEATDLAALFDVDMLGDDLEAWMAESSMLRRTFRNVAVVAGLIERRHPGQEKTGRQVTFNADLIYDVLRKYEPGHVLLRATRNEAAAGLTDIRRLADMLVAVQGRIMHKRLPRVSPLAVPVMLQIGRERVGEADIDMLLDRHAEELIDEAMAPEEEVELQGDADVA
ncbi:ligase-associated DNA damage response DEXH box helicase [Geminicoccus harenae]|uniref:ligase-associated DNA damage response DEXH box helicase n=2 Tax=Geminicoccus harenae TaxID=2498453 RepID=UPI00210378CC